MNDQGKAIVLVLAASLACVLLYWAAKRVARWCRKVKRRRGGVYLVRTLRHGSAWRREIGYVGETVSFHFRRLDHLGQGRHGNEAKDWSDLDPKWHYPLGVWPWWLCWKWLLEPAETLVMLATRPRYNIAKNKGTPRRIPPYQAKIQRNQRHRQLARAAAFRGLTR